MPIWLGDNSSETKKVIERLYACSSILNSEGQYAFYGKVGGCLITGNEDGIKHCAMNVLYSLQHVGYSIPPQADAGWIGEAGPGDSYGDKQADGTQLGFDNDFTNRNTTFMTWNLLHLAQLLKRMVASQRMVINVPNGTLAAVLILQIRSIVRKTVKEVSMKVTKFVNSCLLVETPERVALFDPGMMSKSAIKVDQLIGLDDIFITHVHGDHVDTDLVKELVTKFPDVRITTTPEVIKKLKEVGVTASDRAPEGVVFFDSPHESVQPLFGASRRK